MCGLVRQSGIAFGGLRCVPHVPERLLPFLRSIARREAATFAPLLGLLAVPLIGLELHRTKELIL